MELCKALCATPHESRERRIRDCVSATPPTTVIAFETNGLRNAPDVLWHIADRHDAVLALNHRII